MITIQCQRPRRKRLCYIVRVLRAQKVYQQRRGSFVELIAAGYANNPCRLPEYRWIRVLGGGIRGLIVGKVLEHRSDPLLEQQTALGRECALVTVNLCPYQGRERNVVKQFGERPLLQELFGLIDCLLRVIASKRW